MADFCKQCSEDLFDRDFEDLANITSEGETEDGLFPGVLCEGCGPTQVDHTGKCINKCCLKNHGMESMMVMRLEYPKTYARLIEIEPGLGPMRLSSDRSKEVINQLRKELGLEPIVGTESISKTMREMEELLR